MSDNVPCPHYAMDKAFEVQCLASVQAKYRIALQILSEVWDSEYETDPRIGSAFPQIQQTIGQYDERLYAMTAWLRDRIEVIEEELERLA